MNLSQHSSPPKEIRLLYIGMMYDYGDPNRGLCHEYVNFLGTFEKMESIHVDSFFFDEVLVKQDRTSMNDLLIEAVKEKKPDICFFVLFTDEILKETIRWVTEKSGAITVNWFTDDHWRFDLYSKLYAPVFHWIVTTDHESVEKYKRIGCTNVILSQWGFNQFSGSPQSGNYLHEISFIGQAHSTRRDIVRNLQQKNISVECWGNGWGNGRLAGDEMKQKIVLSKINLNFTASTNSVTLKRLAKIFLHRRSDSTFHLNTPFELVREVKTLYHHQRPQIKGRNFEIPGHGGFLLTEFVDGIDQYYIPDKEIVLFRNFDELVGKISFYLNHEEERESIRLAGQRRTLNDHTYEKRFRQILAAMSFQSSH